MEPHKDPLEWLTTAFRDQQIISLSGLKSQGKWRITLVSKEATYQGVGETVAAALRYALDNGGAAC